MHPHHYAVYGPGGISQTVLGQWLGLRQPQISRIESGPPIRHLDTLQHWVRVLRIPAELLWFRLPPEEQPAATESAAADAALSAADTSDEHADDPRARSGAQGSLESSGYRRGGSRAEWW